MLRAEINLGNCKLLFCSDNTSFLLTEIVMMISIRRSDNFLGLFLDMLTKMGFGEI